MTDCFNRSSNLIPKDDAIQVEWILNDTRGGRSSSQDILLGWQVVSCFNSLHIAQIALVSLCSLSATTIIT